MISRDQIEATAQRYVLKGQLDKALTEYERLLAEDPGDVRTLLKVGDLQVRLGNNQAAIQTYLQVGEHHSKQGFALKAVAVFKQVVTLDPNHLVAMGRLATLYEQQNLLGEAVGQLRQLLERQRARGAFAEAEATLKRLDALEGPSPASHLSWAEIHHKLGRLPQAREALRRAMDTFKQDNQDEGWATAAERLLELDPDLANLACELARHYMARQDPRRALLRLQQAFRAAPQDTETLTLLAEVFEAIEQIPKAITVLHELARQARSRRQDAQHRRVIEHILRLDPADEQAKGALSAPVQGTHHVIDPSAPAPAPSELASGPIDVGKLLIEAQVFRRYGLKKRAIDYLDRLLQAFPEHAEAQTQRRQLVDELDVVAKPSAKAQARSEEAEVIFAFDLDLGQPSQEANNTLVRNTAIGPSQNLAELEGDLDHPIAAAEPKAQPGDALVGPAAIVPVGDAETHMNLGSAYREMGLYDDALAQLELAAASPALKIAALTQKGQVLVAQSRFAEAQAVFDEAMSASALSPSQAATLLYELGSLLERQGFVEQARQAFAKCQAIEQDHRDVVQRLRQLNAAPESHTAAHGIHDAPPLSKP